MNRTPILVTGATDNTGMQVVTQLLAQGFPVRAFVHRQNDKTTHLASLGADIMVGDLLDIGALRAATEGITRAYYCYPTKDHLLESTTAFAVVARDNGLQAVVNMSQIIAREGAPSPLSRQHWLAERVLDRADIGAIHIRPTFFAELLLLFTRASIAQEGKIYFPYGDGKHAPICAEDIARVVVGLLSNPEPHLGKTYVVTGERAVSMQEIATIFSAILDTPVSYVDLPLPRWQQMLASRGVSPFMIEHFSYASEDYKNGLFSEVTNVVQTIGGAAPQSLEDFLRDNLRSFGMGSNATTNLIAPSSSQKQGH